MSQLRERIALLITTAENQGWQTIVAPIDFMRAAFLQSPAGMEQRLRERALRLRGTAADTTLGTTDRVLLDEAADMIAALSAPLPEDVFVRPRDPLRLIHLIDIIDHALLYLPAGEVREDAQATRAELWKALTSEGDPEAGQEGPGATSANGTELVPVTAEQAEGADIAPADAIEPFDARASIDAVATVLREVMVSAHTGDESPSEEKVVDTAERIDQLYAYDLERLKRERLDSKQFESSMINEWLEAHEKSIDAERRALKARQREREAVERCAKIAEEPVDLPPDARAIRLTVHAVQRHIAAAIRNRGLSA